MKHLSEYARNTMDPGGHGPIFYFVIQFPMLHSVFSSEKFSADTYDGDEEEEDQSDVSNAGGNSPNAFKA